MTRELQLQVTTRLTTDGMALRCRGRKWRLSYPDGIWGAAPASLRRFLHEQFAALFTINVPQVSGAAALTLDTPMPLFWQRYRAVVQESIPYAVEGTQYDTATVIRDFHNTRYGFADGVPALPPATWPRPGDTAILPFSCGKDSLSTLALCRELGLRPVCVYIDDTVSPSENRLKHRYLRAIGRDLGVRTYIVRNELEQFADVDYWHKPSSLLPYSHMLTGFMLAALPVAYRERAAWIIPGNQQDMNYPFVNKDGYRTYPSVDQTAAWLREQHLLVQQATAGRVGVCSLIEPFTNLALMGLLTRRYPEVARHEISCDSLDISDEPRWCHACNKCARLYLFTAAAGIDPALVGFHTSMFGKGKERCFSLFRGEETDCYEMSVQARDQQLLAFRLAADAGFTGACIDRFRRQFAREEQRRHRELLRAYLDLQPAPNLPAPLRRDVARLYADHRRRSC